MKTVINDLTPLELFELRNSVGWKKISISQLEKGLNNTKYKVKVLVDGALAGGGRIVSDNSCMGVLNNIIVKPEYQKLGIGKLILNSLFDMVNKSLKTGERFQIEASPTNNNREFYIKCGMKYKPENQDGTYLWIEKNIFKMDLDDNIFNKIKNKSKNILIDNYSEYLKALKKSYYIDFKNKETHEKITVKVININIYNNLKEFNNNVVINNNIKEDNELIGIEVEII